MGSASLLFYAMGLCLFAEVAMDRVGDALDFLSVVGREAKRAENMAKEIAASSSGQQHVAEVIASYRQGMPNDGNFKPHVTDICRKLSCQQVVAGVTLSEENRVRLKGCSGCVDAEYFKTFEIVENALKFLHDFGLKVMHVTGLQCSRKILTEFLNGLERGYVYWGDINFQRAVIEACQTLQELEKYEKITFVNENQARHGGCQCISLLTKDFQELKARKDLVMIIDLEVYDYLEMLGQSIKVGDEVSLREVYSFSTYVEQAMDERRFRYVCESMAASAQRPRKTKLPLTTNQEMRNAACDWLVRFAISAYNGKRS